MKALIIIAQRGFQDKEYLPVREKLEKANIEVEVASVTTEEAIGKFEGKIKPDLAIKNADPSNYNAIVIIGGPGTIMLAEVPEIYKLLKQADEQEKLIAAICLAPTILAKADLLRMKKATVWNGDGVQSAIIEREGAQYTGEDVTIDGRIITANGPDAAEAFGEKVAEMINTN